MRIAFCVACGSTEDLQHHHLVTKAEGGSDDESNLITLCCPCHHKVHARQMNGTYNASQRTKAALQAAKARGVRLGNPRPETALFRDRKAASAAGTKGGAASRLLADRFALLIEPLLEGELAELSANAIAAELNHRGVQTARGGTWPVLPLKQDLLLLRRRQRDAGLGGKDVPL